MITLKEIQQHFDDVSVKDGDMGKYAEIRVLGNIYIHVYKKKEYIPELYIDYVFASCLWGVKTIKDLESLIKLILGDE